MLQYLFVIFFDPRDLSQDAFTCRNKMSKLQCLKPYASMYIVYLPRMLRAGNCRVVLAD